MWHQSCPASASLQCRVQPAQPRAATQVNLVHRDVSCVHPREAQSHASQTVAMHPTHEAPEAINDYDHAKCSRLKSNLAINLISKSFSVCLDKDSFSFQDENILVLNIFMATEQFCVKINENRLEFLNTSPIEFQPQQIRQFELHFISDQQITPSYTINLST